MFKNCKIHVHDVTHVRHPVQKMFPKHVFPKSETMNCRGMYHGLHARRFLESQNSYEIWIDDTRAERCAAWGLQWQLAAALTAGRRRP